MKENYFFSLLSEDEKTVINSAISYEVFSFDETIILDGNYDDDIYFIEKGDVGIFKKGSDGNEFKIASLNEGSYFGEMSFLDGSPRSASIKALGNCVCSIISKNELIKKKNGKNIIKKIQLSIAINQNERIRNGNKKFVENADEEINQLKENVNFGKFFIAFISSIIFVILSNHIVTRYFKEIDVTHLLFSWAYLILIVAPMFFITWKMNYKIKQFNLTYDYWWKDATWGITVSVIIIFFMIIFSQIFYYYFRDGGNVTDYINTNYLKLVLITGFFFHSYLQELCFRGIMLNSFKKFFMDERGHFSVFISAFVFGMVHMHLGVFPVLITTISGVVLGYIFIKRPSVLSISIIHTLVGFTALFIGII